MLLHWDIIQCEFIARIGSSQMNKWNMFYSVFQLKNVTLKTMTTRKYFQHVPYKRIMTDHHLAHLERYVKLPFRYFSIEYFFAKNWYYRCKCFDKIFPAFLHVISQHFVRNFAVEVDFKKPSDWFVWSILNVESLYYISFNEKVEINTNNHLFSSGAKYFWSFCSFTLWNIFIPYKNS